MKKILFLLLALTPTMIMAQMTPEAIIADTPALPSAEEWGAAGEHSNAFKEKIQDLEAKLNKILTTPVTNITAKDMQQVQAQQMQEIKDAPKRMEQAAKGLEMLGMLMERLDLSEADMRKLAKMNDKESETFIMKRMQEKGLNPNEIATMVSNMGLDVQPPANTPKIDPQVIIASQEADMAYMEQFKLYEKKSTEWEEDANKRIQLEKEKYLKSLPENRYGLDDVVTGNITREQYDSQQRQLQSLLNDYRTTAYRIWTEVIHNCQGELKILLQYAIAADDAKRKIPGMTGNEAFDRLQQNSNNAVSIVGTYLSITKSEPKILQK